MKSIKPGRVPSFLSAFVCFAMAAFGLIWSYMASAGGYVFMLSGLLFTLVCAVMGVVNLVNATRKKRFSSFDITEDGEENDPLNEKFGGADESGEAKGGFCPYCGKPVEDDHTFCRGCGKKL